MPYTRTAALALSILSTAAAAQTISTFAQLETILDDQILLEDFEGISVHTGSTIEVPNPLNTASAAAYTFPFGIITGVDYSADTTLHIRGGYFSGQDEVYLRATNSMTITYDQPQTAVGFDIIAFTSSPPTITDITVHLSDGSSVQAPVTQIQNFTFFGYQSPTIGIESIEITSPSATTVSIDNHAFGAVLVPCPADINNDNTHNFADVTAFLTAFANGDDAADYTDDGNFNFADVTAFLSAFAVTCP
jgi:hypothetical protein